MTKHHWGNDWFDNAGQELRDPVDRVTNLYNSLTPDQKKQFDAQITSGQTWGQLAPDQRKAVWRDESTLRAYVVDGCGGNCRGFADYLLLVKYPPPLTSLP